MSRQSTWTLHSFSGGIGYVDAEHCLYSLLQHQIPYSIYTTLQLVCSRVHLLFVNGQRFLYEVMNCTLKLDGSIMMNINTQHLYRRCPKYAEFNAFIYISIPTHLYIYACLFDHALSSDLPLTWLQKLSMKAR